MTKEELLLLGLKDGRFSPVQVQKLFFLIDENIPQISKNYFDFQPYNYGPFDKSIYSNLQNLRDQDLVNIEHNNFASQRYYSLTAKGEKKAKLIYDNNPKDLVDYIFSLSSFVRSLSFGDLVSSIYKAYPKMKINSIFTE